SRALALLPRTPHIRPPPRGADPEAGRPRPPHRGAPAGRGAPSPGRRPARGRAPAPAGAPRRGARGAARPRAALDRVAGATRTAGTGLPEIQRGWWNSSEYGRVYRLTTTGRDLVLIETTPDASTARPGTRYLFSPADPEDFVRLVDAVREGDAAGAGLEPAGR